SGFGYGADMNGLAEQSQPTQGTPIRYPFKSFNGRVTFRREAWGRRVFDLNRDGVANYGMYPDWLTELRVLAGRPIIADMFRGAEASLGRWGRAGGVAAAHCLSTARAARVRIGEGYEAVLYAAGQPRSRASRTYHYCLGAGRRLAVVFDRRGRVRSLER